MQDSPLPSATQDIVNELAARTYVLVSRSTAFSASGDLVYDQQDMFFVPFVGLRARDAAGTELLACSSAKDAATDRDARSPHALDANAAPSGLRFAAGRREPRRSSSVWRFCTPGRSRRRPATLSRNDNGDTVLHEWIMAWVAHQVVANPLHLFDANIFYPERHTLAYSDHLFVQSMMGAPLLWAGASPVLVHNLVLMAGFALTGWTTCLVSRDGPAAGWRRSSADRSSRSTRSR